MLFLLVNTFNFSLPINNLNRCFATDKIPPLVSFGAKTVVEAKSICF